MDLKEYKKRIQVGETIYINPNMAIEWFADSATDPKTVTATIIFLEMKGTTGAELQINERQILTLTAEEFEVEAKERLLISENKKIIAVLDRKNNDLKLSSLYSVERYTSKPDIENDYRELFFNESFPNYRVYAHHGYTVVKKGGNKIFDKHKD